MGLLNQFYILNLRAWRKCSSCHDSPLKIGLICQFVEVRGVLRGTAVWVQNKAIKLPEFKVQTPSRLQPGGGKLNISSLVLLSGLVDARHHAADVMNSARKISAAVSCFQPVKTKLMRNSRESLLRNENDYCNIKQQRWIILMVHWFPLLFSLCAETPG